jgi:hypothetical protein
LRGRFPASRNPLTGLSGLQPGGKPLSCRTGTTSRNPLTGLSSLQPIFIWRGEYEERHMSQSPYGAKRFATTSCVKCGKCATLSGDVPVYGVAMACPYGAMWFATSVLRNPLLSGLQPMFQTGYWSRNPLTGLSGLQLYPPKNALLDGTAEGGVCEKDEAWNMHGPKGGRFAGFRPMGRLRRKGQGRMHRRISPSPWEETGFQGPLPDARDEDIIALSGNGVPSAKACQKRRKEGHYTLRKREEMPSPPNKADGGSN